MQQFPALSLSLSASNCRGRQATRPPMSAFSINDMVLQEAAANGRLKVVAKRAGGEPRQSKPSTLGLL
ncbi:hypothetical protein Trihar35433_1339 [Trichoderma harzianum]|nr:hypothetical protein Trihar35433_1339 [Trichoderma harzianum]